MNKKNESKLLYKKKNKIKPKKYRTDIFKRSTTLESYNFN